MVAKELSEKLDRVCGILDRLEQTNQALDFHRDNKGVPSSIEQFEYIRKKLITELRDILGDFRLSTQELTA
jgi:hypothetical protein